MQVFNIFTIIHCMYFLCTHIINRYTKRMHLTSNVSCSSSYVLLESCYHSSILLFVIKFYLDILLYFYTSCYYLILFLGAFAKLRKATISFVMSVCPSVSQITVNNSAPTGRIFINFDI
jgi:hypothetical protein